MNRVMVERAYARRMKREKSYAARLTAQLTITKLDDARAGAQRVIDEAVKGEYLRAIRRAQRMIGRKVPATATLLAKVLERHRIKDSSRRARAVLTSAMTAARTAGTLDVLRTLALKRKKKGKKKAKKLIKEWVNDPGSNICDECDALDGQRVNAYTGMFRLTDADQPRAQAYFGDEIEGPPLHPSCRCDLLIDRA